MKKIMSMLAIMLALVSCNKQEVYECSNTLVIYINGKSLTRTALDKDPKSVENNVNTLTVGVFASDGTVKTIHYFSSVGKSVTMRVLNLNNTDKVICAINTTNGMFDDVKNIQDFNNKELELGLTVSKDGVNLSAENLAMYGESGITQSGDGYVANVDAYHLNAKITLNSLKTDIRNNGKFIPREIFLVNVPSKIKMSYTNPYTSYEYYYGALNTSIPNEAQKQYIGYGNINNPINQLFFYSSPNNSDKYTKIVICGMYDADGNGPIQQKMTFYPIVIDKTILANKNYVLNVLIKGAGVDSPTQDLNYSNLTVNLNVKDFEDISKNISLE